MRSLSPSSPARNDALELNCISVLVAVEGRGESADALYSLCWTCMLALLDRIVLSQYERPFSVVDDGPACQTKDGKIENYLHNNNI